MCAFQVHNSHHYSAAPRAAWPAPEPRGSIAHEWGLCCGEEWKLAAINSAYFVGAFVGASCGGVLCDAVGRRASTIGAVVANGVTLGLSALATGPWLYALARFVTGAANMVRIGFICFYHATLSHSHACARVCVSKTVKLSFTYLIIKSE